MGYIFESNLSELIFLLVTSLTIVYFYFIYCYTYWEKRNVPFIPPKFPLGNCRSLLQSGVHFNLSTRYYYDLVKNKGLKYGGVYILNRPILIVRDPEYIKDILTKDFDFFPRRTIYFNEKDDPISAHLFAIGGSRWKNLRNKLTPTFTSGKIKSMFPIILNLTRNLVTALDKATEEKSDIDIYDYSAKFTTDVVCNVAFGLDSDTFNNPNSEFRETVKKLGDIDNIFQFINYAIIARAPSLASKLRLIGTRKDISDYFHNLIHNTVTYRKENNIQRPDFLQLLNELMEKSADSSNPFTWEDLVAQCFLFFFAGFDTSSTTMLFTLFELSRHQDVQEKVRKEIESVIKNYNGELTYEALGDLKYLQQVIDESQRLYPPITTIDRVCNREYKLRDSNATIGKGVTALIPVASLHRDPEYYSNPGKFDPERFNPENKKLRHSYLHLPFGEGPKNCIGARFALVQTKIGLASIIRNFKLILSPSTQELELDDNSFFLRPMNTIYLRAENI